MARALRFLPGFTQSRPFKASLKMEPQFAPALSRLQALSRRPVRVLHPEDLILLKLGAGGPQDLSDVGGLLADPPPQLNLSRLKDSIAVLYRGLISGYTAIEAAFVGNEDWQSREKRSI